MPKNRDFAPLDPLPATWPDSLEEFVSQSASGFTVITKAGTSGTVLQVPVPEGYAQVTIGMQGRWRWNTVAVERAVPTGAARSLDLWVTAGANSFAAGSPGEVDNTVYAFALVITESGVAPTGAALSRFVGRATWDGTKVTAIDLTVGAASGTARHAATHGTNGSDPLTPAMIGAATAEQLGAVGTAIANEAQTRFDADANNPSAGEKAALAGTSGTPAAGNRYVTNGDTRLSNARAPTAHTHPVSEVTGLTAAITVPRVTALPTTGLAEDPTVDLVVPSFVDQGTVWRMRYRSASTETRKWEFVGGAPLSVYSPDVINAVNGFASLVSLTVPFAGRYFVSVSTQVECLATSGAWARGSARLLQGGDVALGLGSFSSHAIGTDTGLSTIDTYSTSRALVLTATSCALQIARVEGNVAQMSGRNAVLSITPVLL